MAANAATVHPARPIQFDRFMARRAQPVAGEIACKALGCVSDRLDAVPREVPAIFGVDVRGSRLTDSNREPTRTQPTKRPPAPALVYVAQFGRHALE